MAAPDSLSLSQKDKSGLWALELASDYCSITMWILYKGLLEPCAVKVILLPSDRIAQLLFSLKA
jgi:hypothetical protein